MQFETSCSGLDPSEPVSLGKGGKHGLLSAFCLCVFPHGPDAVFFIPWDGVLGEIRKVNEQRVIGQ